MRSVGAPHLHRVISLVLRRLTLACVRRWRPGRAADVHVRDAGAVRGLAAQQAAAGRAGRLPAGARAQGNAGRAAPPARPAPPAARAPGLARAAPARALPRVAPPPPPQLPRGAALPQLLLSAARRRPSPTRPARGGAGPARRARRTVPNLSFRSLSPPATPSPTRPDPLSSLRCPPVPSPSRSRPASGAGALRSEES